MKPIQIDIGFLATKNKSLDRFLYVGKIGMSTNRLFFYIIEILSPWLPSSKAKDVLANTLEKNLPILESEQVDFEDFESIIQNINNNLERLYQKGDNEWLGNLNAIVGMIYNNDLFLTQAGNIVGYIFRKNKISALTERKERNENPNPAKTFEDLTSGQIFQGDRLVLGNSEFYSYLSLDRIRKTTETGSARFALSDLAKNLKKMKISSANAIIITASQQEDQQQDLTLPETIFIDETNETVKKFIKNKFIPYSKKILAFSGQELAKFYAFSKRHLARAKKDWDTNYGPKTKSFLEKNGQVLKENYHKTSQTIMPKISKKLETILDKENKPSNLAISKKGAISLSKYSDKTKKISAAFFSFLKISISSFVKGIIFIFDPKNRKYLYILCILLLIFAGYWKIRSNTTNKDVANKVQETANAIEEAKTLYNQATEDIALGRGGWDKLDQALVLAGKSKEMESTAKESGDLINNINKKLDEKIKATRIYSANLTSFDLTSGIEKTAIADSEIYGINNEGKIYSIDKNNSDIKLVGSIGTEAGNILDITYSESNKRLYLATDKNGLIEFDTLTKTQRTITPLDGTWEDSKAIITYVSNLYLLDSEAGTVWKHIGTDNGFEKGTAYLNAGDINIRGSVDLAIDGNIYLLQNDGNVLKFNRQSWDSDFSLKGLPTPSDTITIPKQLFTDENTNNIFILDQKLNRIIIFDKSGNFQSQYIFDDLKIEQFIINPKDQKLWITTTDKKLFELSL